VKRFGKKRVLDIAGINGYYTALMSRNLDMAML